MHHVLSTVDKEGVCFVADTVRECDDLAMELMTNDVVLVRGKTIEKKAIATV